MRGTKKLIYGLIFVVIIGSIGYGIYSAFFKAPPTCFDNKKNGLEEDIDCGGPCAVSCQIKKLLPIEAKTQNTVVFDVADGKGVVTEIYNPNSGWSAKSFTAVINLKDALGKITKSYEYQDQYIYAGELKYIVEPLLRDVNIKDVVSAEITTKDIVWVSLEDLKKPDIVDQEVKIQKNSSIFVSGKIVNREEYDFSNIGISAVLFNKNGKVLTASKTVVDFVEKFSSKEFKVIFSKEFEIYNPIFGIGDFLSKPLYPGDSGNDVKDLQELLKEGGAFPLEKVSTGYYDADTAQAVAALQTSLGIQVTGIYDEATVSAVRTLLEGNIPQVTKLQEELSVDPSRTKVFIEARK